MIGFLRRTFAWLILAAGTVCLPFFSLSDGEISWTQNGPYDTIDMGGTVAESADPVVPGSGTGNLVYTVTATNYGPDAADGASAVFGWDNLPTEAIIDSVVVSVGTTNITASQINWTIGPLAAGQDATMTITITVGASVPATEYFEYTCYFLSEATDPNPSNDMFDGTTSIAGIIRVDRDAAPGGNGVIWPMAYNSLVTALGASDAGDELWVAEGVYQPDNDTFSDGDPFATYQLKSGVRVYGGFNGTETARGERNPAKYLSVLSGDVDGNDTVDSSGITQSWTDLVGANAYHVITAIGTDSTAVLNGFVVTGGWAAGGGDDSTGAAVLCDGADSKLRKLYVVGNRSDDRAALAGCTGEISKSLFESNYAGDVGAIADVGATYDDSVFIGNAAMNSSSVFHLDGGLLVVSNCVFRANDSPGSGVLRAQDTALYVANVLFSGNQSNTGPAIDLGGTSGGSLTNVTVAGNQTLGSGGAVNITSSGAVEINNSILWGNTAPPGTGVLESSISYPGSGTVTVKYSLVQGSGGSGAWTASPLIDGGGNLDVVPLFFDFIDGTMTPTTRGNYRVSEDSPTVNVGDNALNPLLADLDGLARVLEGVIDMGAYEAHGIFFDDFEYGDVLGWTKTEP